MVDITPLPVPGVTPTGVWAPALNEGIETRYQKTLGKINALVFDVRDYGAVGDGITDDTNAIQDALDAAAAGGVVWLPAGSYRVTATLTMSNIGVTLAGVGPEGSKLVVGATLTGTTVVSITAYNCRVINLSVNGSSGTTTSNAAVHGITITGARRTKITQCAFFDLNGYAVRVHANATIDPSGTMLESLVIRECAGGLHFLGHTAQGFDMDSFASQIQIVDAGVSSGANANLDAILIEDAWDVLMSDIFAWMDGGSGSSLHIKGSSAATFVQNFDGLGSSAGPTVLVEDGANGSPQNTQITGGVIQQGSVGVQVSGAASQFHLNLSRIIRNQTHGVVIAGTSASIFLTELFFSLNGDGAAGTNYDLNWSGSAKGYVTNCRFSSPITAVNVAGVQTSINVALDQNVRVWGCSFVGTGSTAANRFTNLPGLFVDLSDGTFVNRGDLTLALPSGKRLSLQPTVSGNNALATNVLGTDAFDRFRLLGSGKQEWGTGAAARDTELSRKSAGVLQIGTKEIVIADAHPRFLTLGETTIPRETAASAVTMTSGTLRLCYFTALKTETIATIRAVCAGTAAGATPTLVRYGVYSVDPGTGDLTLIASTVNDTALFAANNTQYPKALSATWDKVAGTRYAIGLLVVTAAAAPTIDGAAFSGGSAEMGAGPRISGNKTGETDLPATITDASLTNTTSMIYAAAIT